jgi:alpha-L-fucosidase 2
MSIFHRSAFAILVLTSALSLRVCAAPVPAMPETQIWFAAPATSFTESSPLGNGRLGAMLFGDVDHERIVLNESSVWSGSVQNADRPEAYKVLPEIQRLLLAGKNTEAETLVNANFTCQGPGSAGAQYGCYQVLGNLHLAFAGDTNAAVTDYRRELNLNDAVATVSYQRAGVRFQRQMFASHPDEVIVLQLTASQRKQISFDLSLDRPERSETVPDGSAGLLMTGQLDNGTDGKGLRYVARVRVLPHGGQVSTHGHVLNVTGAESVTILIAAGTDYIGFAGRQTKDPLAATLNDLNLASRKSITTLLKAHVADYQKFFNRVALHLDPLNAQDALKPTPQRILLAKDGPGDPNLAALYFNFGRYLLISSSRPGGLPPNLQGIWAEEVHTPWNGDWHLDVNVQMNYWPAEVCNLSDLTEPLFALIASLQAPGARTAQAYYHARGWVAHVIANPWGFTSPGESASWGATTGGSAWLCQHLWDHWLFTDDTNFLARAYPIMKGAAQFYSDLLIEEPKHHYLVVAPANSPENHFYLPDGHDTAISLGTTVHAQMLRYLFDACIDASKILNTDADFRAELDAQRARLAPTQIGSNGCVMEWPEEYREAEPHHRHISNLWGLYPGDEITPELTPALAQASRNTLIARGVESVGWSYAYKAALWARLNDGDHAWLLIQRALNPVTTQEIRYDNGGGVYPNLFDACPPFQIDANFGVPAAIAELLVQSRNDTLYLLPALPSAWSQGTVTGLCTRGGFVVDLKWQNGRLQSATIHSRNGAPCRVQYRDTNTTLDLKKGQNIILDGNLAKHL